MNKIIIALLAIFVLALAFFVFGLAYIVPETHQVVITQFGDPVGDPITAAGLHFKKPFIQEAHFFEKRLLAWDGDPNQIPTRDKKYIWVDSTARWKITNALKFLQTIGDERQAHAKLDDIINSATRDAITGHPLVEAVRNSNRIIILEEEGEDMIITDEALEEIEAGRVDLEESILEATKEVVRQYGIEVIDVRIKRLNYVKDVREDVYERMISERKRAAALYRSQGKGKAAEIEGSREKELKRITSEAYREAETIKGLADAEATRIYADAYNQAPDFYSFLKTLTTYRKTIDEGTTLILTTEDEYYRRLKGSGQSEDVQ